MKITLLIPPTDLDKAYGGIQSLNHILPGIGLAYIAAVLRQKGHQVSVLDAYVQRLSESQAVEQIMDLGPDILGVSLLTTSAPPAEAIISTLRSRAPKMTVVMGNVHANVFAQDLLARGLADFIVFREGEATMAELAAALQNGQDPDTVAGLAFMRQGKYITTPDRTFLEDLDTLPYPAWDLFPLHLYRADPRSVAADRHVSLASLPILASRGCPNRCTFCSSKSNKSLGSRYRMRKPKEVALEMLKMSQRFGARSFFFADLSFPLVIDHGLQVCEEIMRLGLHKDISWRCEMRVKPISEQLLMGMKSAGCDRVMFGIESGSDEMLRRVKKGFSTQDVRQAVALCNKVGMDVDGMFMFGLPGESHEMAEQTLRFALELNPRFISTNLFVPYPGCDLYEELKAQGKIDLSDLGSFTSYPAYGSAKPVYIPEGWTVKELQAFQKRFARRFYLRPSFIFRQLAEMRLEHLDLYWKAMLNILKPVRP